MADLHRLEQTLLSKTCHAHGYPFCCLCPRPTVLVIMKKVKTPPPTLDKPLDIAEIKTDKAAAAREIHQSIKKRVANIRKAADKYSLTQLDELLGEIDLTIKTKRHELDHGPSSGPKMNGRQLLAQLADLTQSTSDDPDERKSLKEMKTELESYLPIVLDKELFQWFFAEMNRFRSEIEALRASVALGEKQAQSEEQELLLRRSIAAKKGYDDINMLKGDVMKQVEVCATIPKSTRDLLFHPVWLSRKLEREFTCVVEKSHDVHSKSDGCFIAGTARDVDACIKKLETVDFISGKTHLLLDGKTLSTVMGVGGANAYEIEKDCGVILYAPPGSVELSIYGSDKAVKKAMDRIGTVKQINQSESSFMGISITSERLSCNTAVAKALQSLSGTSIEEKCGVSITVSPSSDSVRDSWVTVRGTPDSVARGSHEIANWIKRMHLESIDVTDTVGKEVLDLLLGSSAKRGMGEIKLGVRFGDLKKRAVIVRVPDACIIDLATLSNEDVENIVNELNDILAKALFKTDRVDLSREHSRCWTEEICSQVASLAGGKEGMMIFYRRSDDQTQVWLELWGSDRARANAARLVDEVHDAKILSVPEEAVQPMLENKCQVLQSIQSDATVTAYFSKMSMELWIYGIDANKKAAAKMFAAFVDSVHQAALQHTIKTIPIASDEIGRLIGPKGRTMHGIRDKAQLEDMRISEQDMKVYLTGSHSSIDYAISLIEEELSSRKDATVVQIGLAEDEATTDLLNSANSGSTAGGTVGLLGAKTNEWTSSDKTHTVSEPVAMDNQDLFPSLGASGVGSSKPKWKKR